MPGCTVPFCSNSTNKGFKVYHFPRDEERNRTWVQNCGRGQGWQPTDHTCICEVHFEDSQFESHRADGVRKLKPNAIPTIFKKKPVKCYSRKVRPKNEQPGVESAKASSSYFQFILDGSSVSPHLKVHSTSIVLANVQNPSAEADSKNVPDVSLFSKKQDIFADHTYPKCVVLKPDNNSNDIASSLNVIALPGSSKEVERWDDQNTLHVSNNQTPVAKNSLGKKLDLLMHSVNKTENGSILKPEKRSTSISNKHNSWKKRKDGSVKNDKHASNIQCYVCDKIEEVTNCSHLLTNTDTSKENFHQKLTTIVVSEKIPLSIEENGYLCAQCASSLNHADQMETELRKIKETIANHLCQKNKCLPNILQPEDDFISLPTVAENIIMTPHQLEIIPPSFQTFEKLHEGFEINKDTLSTKVDDLVVLKEIQCHLCRFKSPHKSFMLFHLRQHLKTTCWCDFCKKSLSDEDQVTNDYGENSGIIDANDQEFPNPIVELKY